MLAAPATQGNLDYFECSRLVGTYDSSNTLIRWYSSTSKSRTTMDATTKQKPVGETIALHV